jgi:large subunit ribosomal protein L3
MNKVLIGRKAGMTQVYDDGEATPVTAVESTDCVLVQKRTVNGQPSLQIGFDETSNATKPLEGHFESQGVEPRRVLNEFIVPESSPLAERDAGDEINVDLFEEGDMVDVVGKTKGRGFSGVVRRWDFSGGKGGHGGRLGRRTGAIGQSADPSRVFPGKKMPGQYGNDVTTIQNLEIVRVFPDEDVLLVSGSVPGSEDGTLIIHSAVKGEEPVASN